MAESRNSQISINIEPSLYNMAGALAAMQGLSMSEFGRNLIIWELVNKNYLDKEQLAAILTGRTVDKLVTLAKMMEAAKHNAEQVAT